MVGSKYLQHRDHQDGVNSVDSNDILEIFCSASCDGVIKIWDKDKTLLREIIMNETLTVASFLNDQGDILIGFKQHIVIIPNAKVYPMKDGLLSAFGDDNLDDDAFETESDIYQDPSVRFESKKILQPDSTNMDNYLVPFPNLQLKTSWFMEGRPPPDLEQQNQQEEKEKTYVEEFLCVIPCSLGLICVYNCVMRDYQDEKAKDEPVQGSQPSCDQCTGALKQEGKRNVPFIPSFRRGRLGNISIDSKSLRSGHGGPGYAAPVVRKVVTENSEPKSFKPRHPPKPVVKKTKKSKESEKEDSVERSGNQDGYKSDNESTETKKDMNVDDAVSESKNDDASYRPTTNAHVLNMSEDGGETPSKGNNPGGSWLSREPLATMHNGVHAQTKENQTKATDVGTAKDEGDPQEETPALSTHKATEGNRAKTQLGGKTIVWNTEEEIQNEDQNSAFDGTNGNNGETFKTQRSEELPDIDYYMVSYTGPVCEEMQHGQGKVSERAEVMDAFDEHDEAEGIDEARTSCGKTQLSSLLHYKGGEQGQKKVKASGGDNRRRHRNLRHLATRRNSPFSRVHNSSVTLKESVLPVYNGRRRTYSPSEISKNSMNVTPVTIFALARNRQENTSQKHGRSVNGSLGQKKEMTETSNLSKKEADKGMFELHNDDIMQVMDKTDWKRPAYHGTVDISRPPSVQKSESSLMRWCIKALKKVDLEVLFPPKPTRPKSSPSSVKSETAKRERDEGDPQEETPALSTHKATEGNRAKTQLGGKTIVWNTEEEIQNEDQNSAFDGTNGNNGETFKTQRSEELPDIDYYMVSYTGPVCEEMQHGQGKVSERAEVMDAFDEHDEAEGIDEARTSCGKTQLSSLLHYKGGEQGQKKVKASGGDNRRRHRNLRHLATRRNSPFSRVHNSSVTLKESVLPVYNGRRRTYSPSEISKNSMNVTPVTIFALARNRQENTSQKHGRSVNGSLGQKKEMTETSNLSKKEADKGMFELHNDDIMQVMDKTDWKRPAYHGTVDISRPPSVQKSESSLMRWCIKALKKVDLEVLFPPKPTRPKSSPSSVKSETAKRERGNLIQLNNSTTQRSRPKTADSILSTASSTKDHSWFHHEDNPSTNETAKQQPRDFKSAASLVQSSKWEQVTSDNDEHFLDGYRAMQSGIVFQEPEEDDVKDMSRESAGFERASRLQQLRQERQKTAKERRQALESKQREKWKNSSHLECAQVSKCEGVIEFITPPPTTSSRKTTPLPSSDLIQNRLVKEREFASERPYRLRLSSESIGQRLNPVARNLINLKTSDHHVSDVVNVLPNPPPSASIPSKCRASRLQQLRQERQKTAKERRQALESKQREKWKNSSHLECAQVSKCEGVIEFITPPPTTSSRKTTPLPSSDLIQNRLVKEREFASERPYRLRLSSESIGQRLNPVARNLINLKTSDHHVSDVVNVLPNPPPSASIPSKCSYIDTRLEVGRASETSMHASRFLSDSNREKDLFEDPLPKKNRSYILKEIQAYACLHLYWLIVLSFAMIIL
ncbi:uncharacterized protein [Montipora foliosa]|uniref:uncharacterized protein n=1 Tax=Montipora foliosa TaxID=591990 RepID=UPI0035F14118